MDSGSEPERVVIRVPQELPATESVQPLPEPEPREPSAPKAAVDVWLAVSILGSILAAFGPLLPWWKITTMQTGIQVSTVVGTGVWPGIIAFVGGVTALATCTYLYTKPDRRGTLGLVILGAGAVAFAASVLAITNRADLVVTILRVGSQVGLYMSPTGGLLAAIGGYLLTREGASR